MKWQAMKPRESGSFILKLVLHAEQLGLDPVGRAKAAKLFVELLKRGVRFVHIASVWVIPSLTALHS